MSTFKQKEKELHWFHFDSANTMTVGKGILPNGIELKRKKFKNNKKVKSIKIEFLRRKTN